ncbi:MAG: lipopolysaccharide kinase InaA family protein [Thermodesulfovibrionales bacterium]
MHTFIRHNNILINKNYLDLLKDNGLDTFEALRDFNGGSFLKKNKYRSVARIELGSRVFYLKRHFWPWRERIRSANPLLRKEDAKNEWDNMLLLNRLGFNTMTPVAFAERKKFSLSYFSLTLTENLYEAEKLEVFFPRHFKPPLDHKKIDEKRTYIKRLAVLARDLHNKGLNHQDFYLGHILIRQGEDKFFIIDLQRMHKNTTISLHDRIKDLAQLAYSAAGLRVFTKTDLLRFFRIYIGSDKLTHDNKKLAGSIMLKTRKISRHDAKLQLRKKRSRVN